MTPYQGLHKVISGGQTGADQAGLIAACRAGLAVGGTAPSGFYTDIGNNPVLECLGMEAAGDYRTRTIKNVKDSDGTVLLSATLDSPGSRLTRNTARGMNKPFIEFDMTEAVQAYIKVVTGETAATMISNTMSPICIALHDWLIGNNVGVLNVAGNREKYKELYTTYATAALLQLTFDRLDVSDLLIRKL